MTVLIIVVALLLVGLISYGTTQWAPGWATTALLRVAKRDVNGIAGLDSWTEEAAAYLTKDDLLARVRWAKRNGKAQVLAARRDLAARLAESAAQNRIGSCPLRDAAAAQAARADVRVGDLLSAGGTRIQPAADLLALFARADDDLAAFNAISSALIKTMPDGEHKTNAEAAVKQGRALADDFLAAFTIDDYIQGLLKYLTQVQRQAAFAAELDNAEDAARYAGIAVGGMLGTAPSARQTRIWMEFRDAVAFAPIVGLALVLILVAAGTVLAAQYLTNPVFGSVKAARSQCRSRGIRRFRYQLDSAQTYENRSGVSS